MNGPAFRVCLEPTCESTCNAKESSTFLEHLNSSSAKTFSSFDGPLQARISSTLPATFSTTRIRPAILRKNQADMGAWPMRPEHRDSAEQTLSEPSSSASTSLSPAIPPSDSLQPSQSNLLAPTVDSTLASPSHDQGSGLCSSCLVLVNSGRLIGLSPPSRLVAGFCRCPHRPECPDCLAAAIPESESFPPTNGKNIVALDLFDRDHGKRTPRANPHPQVMPSYGLSDCVTPVRDSSIAKSSHIPYCSQRITEMTDNINWLQISSSARSSADVIQKSSPDLTAQQLDGRRDQLLEFERTSRLNKETDDGDRGVYRQESEKEETSNPANLDKEIQNSARLLYFGQRPGQRSWSSTTAPYLTSSASLSSCSYSSSSSSSSSILANLPASDSSIHLSAACSTGDTKTPHTTDGYLEATELKQDLINPVAFSRDAYLKVTQDGYLNRSPKSSEYSVQMRVLPGLSIASPIGSSVDSHSCSAWPMPALSEPEVAQLMSAASFTCASIREVSPDAATPSLSSHPTYHHDPDSLLHHQTPLQPRQNPQQHDHHRSHHHHSHTYNHIQRLHVPLHRHGPPCVSSASLTPGPWTSSCVDADSFFSSPPSSCSSPPAPSPSLSCPARTLQVTRTLSPSFRSSANENDLPIPSSAAMAVEMALSR
ncbi:unnamed protein product, partial [Protopolystoma xenopodis]